MVGKTNASGGGRIEMDELSAINSNLDIPLDILFKECLETAANEIAGLLNDSAYGLNALKTLLSTIDTNAGRLTNNRAEYLDYLADSSHGLSAIKTAINNLSSGGMVKCIRSVQRGNHAGSTDSTHTITISSVTPSKTLVILEPSVTGFGLGAYADKLYYRPRMTAISATSLTITGGHCKLSDDSRATAVPYSWQVIEFY